MPNLLAIDQGTTSSRAILFSGNGRILNVQQKELELHYPHKGWVEQNPLDIWNDSLWAVQQIAIEAPDAFGDVAALGITNQRETTILWNKHTGEPLNNAIVWQDRRTADVCASLKEAGHEKMVQQKTGLLLDPYFSATKIAWILDHVDGARAAAEAGDVLFGTVECYLLWKLTAGRVHASDATNAGRTMLFNVVQQEWDDDLLTLFNIPRSILPEVRDNVADYGVVDTDILPGDIPIGGMAGDQHAALIGQACFKKGMVKSTYGTGCFALMNIGEAFSVSKNRLLTTMAYRIDGRPVYAFEGSIFIAGAAIQWLRDGLQVIQNAAESENLACSVNDNGGVYFVPAFTGLGAPHWRPEAQGCIVGLTRDSGKAHVVRAALEAQGYQTLDLMGAMAADSGFSVDMLRVDGGLIANEFVCQFLADMLSTKIEVPKLEEATAWGAACLAGLSAGVFGSLDDIQAQWSCARSYEPAMVDEEREALYAGWQKALKTLL